MKEIFARRSIREFTDAPVEQEKIEKLMKAAMAAPTAGNQQEWEFIIVTDPEIKKQLAVSSPYAGSAAKAPVVVVALCNGETLRFGENWEQDLGAAVENLLLEAVHLDLGAVWLGIAPVPERMKAVSEIFKLPESVLPFALISVGYPAGQFAEVAPCADRYNENKVFYNKYGK